MTVIFKFGLFSFTVMPLFYMLPSDWLLFGQVCFISSLVQAAELIGETFAFHRLPSHKINGNSSEEKVKKDFCVEVKCVFCWVFFSLQPKCHQKETTWIYLNMWYRHTTGFHHADCLYPPNKRSLCLVSTLKQDFFKAFWHEIVE